MMSVYCRNLSSGSSGTYGRLYMHIWISAISPYHVHNNIHQLSLVLTYLWLILFLTPTPTVMWEFFCRSVALCAFHPRTTEAKFLLVKEYIICSTLTRSSPGLLKERAVWNGCPTSESPVIRICDCGMHIFATLQKNIVASINLCLSFRSCDFTTQFLGQKVCLRQAF